MQITAERVPSLREGLAAGEVRQRLAAGLRIGDLGQRILAFYLVEMEERRLYQDTGHSTTAKFARDRLDLDRRRTWELIRVGRRLLELEELDRAFAEGRLGWAKVMALMRVISPDHEGAWIERAEGLTCRQLRRLVSQHRPGSAPRDPGDLRGLPEVRFPLQASLDVDTHRKLDLAKQMLSAECGEAVDDVQLLATLAEMFLQSEADGSLPGRTRVSSSLYRINLIQSADGTLLADSGDGPVAMGEIAAACAACDGEQVSPDKRDIKTPAALRRRVLDRDGHRCRCCGSKKGLMVHHIEYRSEGGPTAAWNLITLCTRCHSMVHADLLVLVGERAEDVRFVDRRGEGLQSAGPVPGLELVLDSVGKGCEEREEAPAPVSIPLEAFKGQEVVVERLERRADGARARGRQLAHTLFVGPPGTGKTTLARGLAGRFGARLHEATGPLVRTPEAVLWLLESVRRGDFVFLDEIHAMPRPAIETLYEVLSDGRIPGGTPLPPFTLVAATSEEGDLPEALSSRFGWIERMEPYTEAGLAEIALDAAAGEGIELSPEAARLIAGCTNATPREVLRLLDRLVDDVGVGARLDLVDVQLSLARLGYDDRGLCPLSQRYLETLAECGGPISLGRLARLCGTSERVLSHSIEPGLIRRGLVTVSSRGRARV